VDTVLSLCREEGREGVEPVGPHSAGKGRERVQLVRTLLEKGGRERVQLVRIWLEGGRELSFSALCWREGEDELEMSLTGTLKMRERGFRVQSWA